MDTLFKFEFDGVNLGNTSTRYDELRSSIVTKERDLYDYFVTVFGGGIGGRPLKANSLLLSSAAVKYQQQGQPTQEFHVIRTGGIDSMEDLDDSRRAGISLNQWHSGYFNRYAIYGHRLYESIY